MLDVFESRKKEFEEARNYGFAVQGRSEWDAYRAKKGSSDDGPEHGPFLGGIGCGNFSRDIFGVFSRWHLQPGYHIKQPIPQARFLVSWRNNNRGGCRFIGVGRPSGWDNYSPSFSGFNESSRSFAVLFPNCYEYYDDGELPYKLILSYWSPLIFSSEDAALPVIIYSITVKNFSKEQIAVSTAFFWPNLLGWRQSRVTAIDRGDTVWPAQTHANNVNRAAEISWGDSTGIGVVQSRIPFIPAQRDLEGEVLLAVQGPKGGDYSREICFKSDQNAIGVDPASQKHTQAWAEEYFAAGGVLPYTEATWPAHWHEPLSSAISCRTSLSPEESKEVVFIQVFDLPLTVFGSERTWTKRYTRIFGEEGNNSEKIASYALKKIASWEQTVEKQKQAVLEKDHLGSRIVKAALLNELFIITGGGSAWTDKMKPAKSLAAPTLGAGEHFAILEGYDTGYYYYNTFDLWTYAFPALGSTWPALAAGVFDDYLKSIDTPNPRRRIVYRVMEEREMLTAGKIPHDLGIPMEDPWNLLNGYTMRDDPNNWRDHNPALIISYYLFAKKTGIELQPWQWSALQKAAQYGLSQDTDGDGLPEHLEFGDTTWDALKFEGVGAFSGGLTLAAYSSLIDWAAQFKDRDVEALYTEKRKTALVSFEEKMWTGGYYRTTSDGAYGECITIDALLGPFYADLAGLGPLLPRERIISHLKAAYERNFLNYSNSQVGPLLVSHNRNILLKPDGGEELQINEVLVGAAWVFCAQLFYYGLREEAERVAEAMITVLYGESGLQFRTPAAWDANRMFRAPFNMRPLSIWLLDWIREGSGQPKR